MAKTKSKKSDDDDDAVDAKSSKSEIKKPRRGGGRAFLVLLVLAGGAGGFVYWHRRKDPARLWARNLESLHATRFDARLQRCFGGSDPAAVRRLIPDIRRGTVPTTFAHCGGSLMSELVVMPDEFASLIGEPPGGAAAEKTQERSRLDQLHSSIQVLQREAGDAVAGRPLAADARDRVANALEDVAVDLGAERTAFQNLIAKAESNASVY